jgi:hypothetical protein
MLHRHARSRSIRIPPVAFGILILVVFAGTIGVAATAGYWQTSGRTTAGGERVVPQGVNVSEIKGWMAIGDVADAWDIPLADLLAQFALPADTPASTAIKELESETFTVTGLRAWLAERSPSP